LRGSAAAEPGGVQTQHGLVACNLAGNFDEGARVFITVRPENISIIREPSAEPSDFDGTVLEGKVDLAAFLGDFQDCRIRVGEQPFRVKVHPSVSLARGETVYLQLPKESCTVLMAT